MYPLQSNPTGTEIRAATSGVVQTSAFSTTAGEWIVLRTNATDGQGRPTTIETRYLHLSRRLVNVGQEVQMGN